MFRVDVIAEQEGRLVYAQEKLQDLKAELYKWEEVER